MWLFAVFLGLPLIEIGLFVTVGGWLGLVWTLAIVIGTGVLGVWIMRRQGQRAAGDLRRAVLDRKDPLKVLAGDVLTVLAGALLVLPGFLTDTLGLLLLLPVTQRLIGLLVARRAMQAVAARATRPGRFASGPHRPADIIDATWEELPPDPKAPPSGWTRH